jgi:hypothetical protein
MSDLRASHMPALAQELVAYFGRNKLTLDLTPESLAVVDTYVTNLRGALQKAAAADPVRAEAEFDRNCQWISGYAGEVIRGQTGGAWIDGPRMPLLTLGEPQVEVLPVVANLLATGRARIGATEVGNLGESCEAAIQLQLAWLTRVIVGTHGSLDALKQEMSSAPDLSAWLVAQCQFAVQTASLKWGEALDFSAGSLAGIERILGALHDIGRQTPGSGPTPEQIDAMCKVWGVYVGEALRRHHGGQWRLDGALVLDMGKAKTAPLAKVRKRIVDGPADNVAFYFKVIGEALAGRLA